MSNLKQIVLREIGFPRFKDSKYTPSKVRKSGKKEDRIYVGIEDPIEYAGFRELLEDIVQTKKVMKVRVYNPGGKPQKGGRIYEIRRKFNREKIETASEKADIAGFLDVYFFNRKGKHKRNDNFLRFRKIEEGKVMSTYLEMPWGEREQYTWKGPTEKYNSIYGVIPTPRER